jgi:hypothetical protein
VSSVRKWLRDDKNRDILKMTAAGLAALVAAGWAVVTFVVAQHPSGAGVVAGPGGIAAGRDISGNTITLAPAPAGSAPPAPPAAASPAAPPAAARVP